MPLLPLVFLQAVGHCKRSALNAFNALERNAYCKKIWRQRKLCARYVLSRKSLLCRAIEDFCRGITQPLRAQNPVRVARRGQCALWWNSSRVRWLGLRYGTSGCGMIMLERTDFLFILVFDRSFALLSYNINKLLCIVPLGTSLDIYSPFLVSPFSSPAIPCSLLFPFLMICWRWAEGAEIGWRRRRMGKVLFSLP